MTSVAASPDWSGPFHPLAFTRVLKRAADEQRTGAIHIVSGRSVKSVHLGNGSIRFAASNLTRDRLGESMLAHEFIDDRDFRLATATMKNDGCRFGEALMKLGRVTQKELDRELAIQVQRIVLSLFRLQDGMYSFDESTDGSGRVLPFGISIPPLLLKGLRTVKDGHVMLDALPPAETLVRVPGTLPYDYDVQKLSPIERSVMELAGEGKEIAAIIRECDFGASAAFRSCFALLTLGFLEPVPLGDGTPEPEAHADAVESPEVSASADVDDAVEDETLEQLERDANIHLQERDWNGAVSLLHELVALRPDVARYQAMLAEAMERHPMLRREAEQHYLEAARLSPDDADLRLRLGRYYVNAGKRGPALFEFETVLSLEPENAEALRGVESLREPTRMQRLLKKIFR